MLFNSLSFVYFFAVVYALYRVLPHRGQNVMLLAASLFFYGYWDWRFLGLMVLSTTVDYVASLGIVRAGSPAARKGWLAASLGVNLLILGAFKYFDFFTTSFAAMLETVGWTMSPVMLHVALPVGISFYTFQAMAYVIDAYRGDVRPTRSYLDFMLFITFFPQLVAGPIERAKDLLGQVQAPRRITGAQIADGVWLLLLGYCKKVVLADNLAPFVEEVFDSTTPGRFAPGTSLMFVVYAGALQFYGDFSGYSDIARGLAKLLGFELTPNFMLPYFATNPVEVWKRWHVTLSTWIRDYVSKPLRDKLGRDREGSFKWRLAVTILVSWFLIGLWHGAEWRYVLWGVLHGVWLVVFVAVSPLLRRIAPRGGVASAAWTFFCWLCFFHIWGVIGILLRATSLEYAKIVLDHATSAWAFSGGLCLATILAFGGPLAVYELAMLRRGNFACLAPRAPAPYAVGALIMFLLILWSGRTGGSAFLYFQF